DPLRPVRRKLSISPDLSREGEAPAEPRDRLGGSAGASPSQYESEHGYLFGSGTIMIYLDNAATSFPKPEPVYQALDRFARTTLANPGRAGHHMALAAEQQLDAGRHALNQLFHGETPKRWAFTLNCTDGLNLAIKGTVQPGDHVITTDLEHNSISRP